MTKDVEPVRRRDLDAVIEHSGKYELYYDLDGTVNARITEPWVKRQWRHGYIWGSIVTALIWPFVNGVMGLAFAIWMEIR